MNINSGIFFKKENGSKILINLNDCQFGILYPVFELMETKNMDKLLTKLENVLVGLGEYFYSEKVTKITLEKLSKKLYSENIKFKKLHKAVEFLIEVFIIIENKKNISEKIFKLVKKFKDIFGTVEEIGYIPTLATQYE